ncbi:hypothetical protein C358_04183 [Cryptococcus neoformans MW-RSA852]|nr:hypothetical protein C358_04183 [Cryptococcus neoformans var. grubii MW-RSA852]
MFLQLEHNQELILKELVILKGLFTSQSSSALTGSKPSRYSTYRVSSPLSLKDENFWKVAAKEVFELSELGEKERRECTPPCGPTERVHGVASHELKSDGAHVEEGKEGGNGGYGSEDEEEFGQGRNVDSSARTGEEDEEDGEEDGK